MGYRNGDPDTQWANFKPWGLFRIRPLRTILYSGLNRLRARGDLQPGLQLSGVGSCGRRTNHLPDEGLRHEPRLADADECIQSISLFRAFIHRWGYKWSDSSSRSTCHRQPPDDQRQCRNPNYTERNQLRYIRNCSIQWDTSFLNSAKCNLDANQHYGPHTQRSHQRTCVRYDIWLDKQRRAHYID